MGKGRAGGARCGARLYANFVWRAFLGVPWYQRSRAYVLFTVVFSSLSERAHLQSCLNKIIFLSCGFNTTTMSLTHYGNISNSKYLKLWKCIWCVKTWYPVGLSHWGSEDNICLSSMHFSREIEIKTIKGDREKSSCRRADRKQQRVSRRENAPVCIWFPKKFNLGI